MHHINISAGIQHGSRARKERVRAGLGWTSLNQNFTGICLQNKTAFHYSNQIFFQLKGLIKTGKRRD